MKYKIIVDTNVFVHYFFDDEDEASSYIIDHIDDYGRFLFSHNTIGELLYILKKISNDNHFSYEDIESILHSAVDMFLYGKSESTSKKMIDKDSLPQINDPDDQMFIELAYAGNADYIISYDKRSGLFNLENVPFTCYTPKEFIKNVLEKNN